LVSVICLRWYLAWRWWVCA